MTQKRRRAKGRGSTSSFLRLPHYVLQSRAWSGLSGWQTKWLLDLMAQYNGNNNGDLSMPWSYLRERGWSSKDTVNRARKGVLKAGWAVVTRKGWRSVPTLYAVTLWGIDECDGKVVEEIPNTVPLGFWKKGCDPRNK